MAMPVTKAMFLALSLAASADHRRLDGGARARAGKRRHVLLARRIDPRAPHRDRTVVELEVRSSDDGRRGSNAPREGGLSAAARALSAVPLAIDEEDLQR